MMNVSIAEGDCCKDSQGLARHVMRTVNSQVERNTTIKNISNDDEEVIWEIDNPKYMRRQDFKNRKQYFKKDKLKSKNFRIKPHSYNIDYLSELIGKLKNMDPEIGFEIIETIIMAILCKIRTSTFERVFIIAIKLCKLHFGVKYSKILEFMQRSKDYKGFRKLFDWKLEDIEAYFKELLLNWKIASKNEAFGSIIALISTIVAIFYGVEKKWTYTIGSFTLFMLDSKNACKGASSLLDAILKVITYVMSGFKTYSVTGEFSAFLYADDQLAEFDALVSKLKATMSLLQPGNLQRCADTDENAFDKELQIAISSGEKLISLYEGPTKKYVMDKVRLLRQIHVDFIQFRSAGGLRVAPFAYLLSGSTGLGKSSLNEILMRYILIENDYNHQDPYICTLNSQDKFFSTYRSYINGVIFDDFANTNSEFVEISPCEILLKFVNNVPFYLNMAELELKGKVVAEPKVIGVTTNVADIDSSVYSNQPSSIMRRLKVHIFAKVKSEFTKEGTIEIDPSKVSDKFGDSLAPDIWDFDVFTVKVDPIKRFPKLNNMDSTMHRDDNWHLEYVQWNGKDMRNANIKDLLAYIKLTTNKHYKEQHRLIERSKLYNGEIICSDCRLYHEHCLCVNLKEEFECDFAFLEGGGFEITESQVLPHSFSEKFYSKVLDERQEQLNKSLRQMLLSWIVEGKSGLDSYLNSFFQKFSEEVQYVLIVLRKMLETWVQLNKTRLMELFIPTELDGTRLGHYMTVVARPNVYKTVVGMNLFVYGLAGYATVSIVSRISERSFIGGIMFPSVLYYKLHRLDLSKSIMLAAESVNANFKKTLEFVWDNERSIKAVMPLVGLAGIHWYYGLKNPAIPIFTCSTLTSLLYFKMFEKERKYNAPKAISTIYRRGKQGVDLQWQRIAPAALAMFTMYYNKESIVDFYVEAWETWCMNPHTLLKPSEADIQLRDKKHRFDEKWFEIHSEGFLDPLPTSKLRTPQEVREAIADNVWYLTNLETRAQSNCFVIHSGCILIPWHFIPKDIVKMKFKRHNRGNKGNSSFESFVDPQQCVRVRNYDLALMWMPKTRDVKSLIDFFPVKFHETNQSRTGRIVTRSEDGDLSWGDVKELYFSSKAQSGLGFLFPGIRYFWSGAKEGKCMSPVITDDKEACISGLHIGGSVESRADGCYLSYGVTPTQEELLEAKTRLEKMSSVIPMSSSGDFYPDNMGVKTLQRCIKKKSCYLRMESDNNVLFFGSSYNCNRTPKSAVRDTPIKSRVKELFDLDIDWGSPQFKGPDGKSPYVPWEVGMAKWIVDRPGLPFSLLNQAKTHYVNNLVRLIYNKKQYWSKEIKVLTWDETVNGIPNKRFIDSMNFKSSIGFPFHGTKRKYSTSLGDTGEGWQDKRVLDPVFIEEAIKIEELYKQGRRYYPWFVANLKDEPTQVGKEKVRVFQATSTPFQLVMRKYTLGICRFLQLNPLDSECAVGIDPCSGEWDEMYNHLVGIQTPFHDRWFAIDYKVYDSSISSQIILTVGRIFVDIARVIGYSDEDIAILHSIFTELSFSIVDFNGDVFMLDGANTSGNSLTVFINNICNSLLMRVFFLHLYPGSDFSHYVKMMAYGDDLIAVVSAFARHFTMVNYAAYMSQFGFIVTPANKEGIMKNFSRIWEVDFLKRKFSWSDDYGAVIAPLDEKSIYKRLCNYMSSTTDVWVIVGANIDGALDEWAFYGREIYLDRQKKLLNIVDEFELRRFVSRVDLTYEQRVSFWKEQHAVPAVMGEGQSMDTEDLNCDEKSSGFFGWGNIFSKMGKGGPPQSHNSESYSSDDLSSINEWTSNIKHDSWVEADNSPKVGELNTQTWKVCPHSAFSMEKEQTMQLDDGSTNQVTEIPNFMDETRKASDSSDNTLGEFLSRPVKIYSFDWSTSISPHIVILPWQLFLENVRVVNKIAGFKMIRGRLRLKVLINGNAFFYGRLMLSYWPFSALDEMTSDTPIGIDNVQFSQMPRVFLDPTTSQGGEMTLPFFWYYDYLDLMDFDSTKIGALAIRELSPLKHTTGDVSVDSKVTVTVFAWMEDVQLEAPTHRNPSGISAQSLFINEDIIPHSGKGKDEHTTETGPITKIATALQAAATIGAMNPTLAPFCTPAMWGARMAAAGAAAMGWSSPSLIEEPKYVEPRGTGSMTLTNVPDTCGKLSTDAKQEITVDPRTTGLGPVDELDIRYIASKESWLTRFIWPLDAVREDLLFNLRVDPCQFNSLTVEGSSRLAITASCGAALPFKYWNGTFKVRLQFVTSAFHRGRVAVVYDPYTTATDREDNVQYQHIVDISSCRDVTFSVGPNQDRTLLKHCLPGFDPVSDLWRSQDPLALTDYGNGTIAIYVINELTIPASDPSVNNDIFVNVFVSMGEDFETFVPSNNFSFYTIKPQSTGLASATPDDVEDSDAYSKDLFPLDAPNRVISNRNLVYSGEQIRSFRNLLKRYYPWAALKLNPAAGLQTSNIQHRIFPAYRGNVPGAVHFGGTYNYFAGTLLNWLVPAFQGFRGSIRYKWFPRCVPYSDVGMTNVYVSFVDEAQYKYEDVVMNGTDSSSLAYSSLFGGDFEYKSNGALTFVQSVNPTIEYEIPWYTDMRFHAGKTTDWTTSESLIFDDGVTIGAQLYIDNVRNGDGFYDVFASAGEDFSCHFFTGWPPLYFAPNPPEPT